MDQKSDGSAGGRNRLRSLGMSALRIIVTAYAGICLLLLFTQKRMVYYPTKDVTAVPADAGMEYEGAVFRTADGIAICGWYVPARDPLGTVLFCHGNGGNICHRMDTIRIYRDLGYDVLIFDYRGYGRSEGRPSEEGTYADAEAAWRYLTEERKIPPDRIVIAGRSLGGAIAAHLASQHTPGALVVESALTSAADVGRVYFPYLPVGLICRFGYNTEDYVRGVKCPVLVVHSSKDELIPFEQGKRVFEAAPEPKQFLEITGSHDAGFLISGQRYIEGLSAFLTGRS